MSDLLAPRPLDRPRLVFPPLDVDAALAALEDEAGEVRPSREDDLRARLGRGESVIPRELFDVLDAEESERLFFELDAATLDAWKQALSDYELIPPWPQLERDVYVAPVVRGRVDLCGDWVLHPGSLVGLLSRGWRGEWRSGGLLCGLRYPVDGGFARIEHAEFVAKRAGEYPPEPIGPLYVDAPSIDRLTLSELLRDLGRERLGG